MNAAEKEPGKQTSTAQDAYSVLASLWAEFQEDLREIRNSLEDLSDKRKNV